MVILFNSYRSQKNDINYRTPIWLCPNLLAFCSAFYLILCGCSQQNQKNSPTLIKLSGDALGTTWLVKVLSDKTFNKEKLQTYIKRKLEETDKIFSHWRPDSALFQFNANQTTNSTIVHPQLYNLLKHAQWMHRETNGAIDPTLGALVNLWGFGPEGKTRSTIPTEKQIEDVQKIIGMENLEISQNGSIRKKVSALQLDLSGSAKGEILDQICNLLDRLNFHNYLVEIGGEVRAQGKGRNGNGWIVGLENGGSREIDLISVPLRNYAVATSGTYRLKKTNPKSPQNASHLLNPKTGLPVEHNLIAVNTFAPTARDADAWATALMVMGLEDGMKKAEEMDLVTRFCVIKDGNTSNYYSTAYHRLYPSEKNF